MTTSLFPRLSRLGVSRVLSDLDKDYTTVDALGYLSEHASLTSYAASGGVRDPVVTNLVCDAVRAIAENCGLPSSASQTGRAKFDRDCAIALADFGELSTGEGLRDDVWAYFATVLLPDVVRWRFESANEDRFQGGARNAIQRLHVRARALDLGLGTDRWRLLRALTEDAHVAIFERPSIGGNSLLARAVAEQWVVSAGIHGKAAMEDIMRSAIKLLRMRYQIIDLGLLPVAQLSSIMGEVFSDASQNP